MRNEWHWTTLWKGLARIALMLPVVQCAASQPARKTVEFPVVRAATQLVFPRDHGSHPDYRTEWWYITGWLRGADGREYGMQVTFFRHRPGVQEDNPSRFAPNQLIFAHAALTDPRAGTLRHDQRAGRAGFGLAFAKQGDTHVRIDQWTLQRAADGYRARITGEVLDMDLLFAPTQSVLPQGQGGFSRKGPRPHEASHYYSVPQLAVQGSIRLEGARIAVGGRAWLDHEWSTEYLSKDAVGWDWAGINLHDGGALMAFRIRDEQGGSLWAGGTHRDAGGAVRVLSPQDVEFTALRQWRSARSAAQYPVEMRLRAGDLEFHLKPLLDDQELDARASTGTLYWEGAVRAQSGGRTAGLGYLELTGYARRLRMR